MNLQSMLMAPWHATRKVTRWMALVLITFLLGTIALVTLNMHGAAHAFWAPIAGMLVAAGTFMLTMLLLSPCLLLAIDARQLRLPGLQRTATGAVLLYGALMTIVPGLLIGLSGGYMLNVMSMQLVAFFGGLAIALLPRVLTFFVWLLPAAFNILQPTLHLPRPVEPAFASLCTGIAVFFALLSLAFWRRMIRSVQPYSADFGAPMLMQMHCTSVRGAWGSWGGASMDPSATIRRNPAWLQPRIALGDSGPAHPVQSLRVGLGGMFAPLTLRSRAMQIGVVLLVSLLFMLQMGVQASQRHTAHVSDHFIHSGLLALLLLGVGMGGSMMAVLPIAQLMQRWAKQNAELPLLALLPGLGDARQVKRHLLCAALLPPVIGLVALMLAMLILAMLLHASALALCASLLTLVGIAAFLTAFVVSVIGGRPLGPWASVGLCVLGYGLFFTSILVPMFDSGNTASPFVYVFAAAWALLLTLLSWLARRGWRGLEKRPHPFLANSL